MFLSQLNENKFYVKQFPSSDSFRRRRTLVLFVFCLVGIHSFDNCDCSTIFKLRGHGVVTSSLFFLYLNQLDAGKSSEVTATEAV